MLVPVGVEMREQVQLVFLAEASLPIVGATLRQRVDAQRYAVELDAPCPLAVVSARVAILGGPLGDTHVLGVIEASADGQLVVRQMAAQTPEDRKSPRTTGHLALRWRVIRPGEPDQPRRWLDQGFSLAAADAWSAPEPEMDVSLDGLRFRDDAPCAIGDALLVELGHPDDDERHRCRAVVRRLIAGPRGREVAVELADVPEAAEDILMDLLMAGD